MKEHSIYKLGQLYTQHGREKELGSLLQSVRPFFATIPKAKTGKIVRTVIDMVSRVHANTKPQPQGQEFQLQADLCRESIAWCNAEKHTFLRQRIEARLTLILFEQHQYQAALDLVTCLLKEIKKLDDKQLLVEIHLIEAKVHHALKNLPKAKAALTAARSVSNAVYIVPKVQSSIDMTSGTLHAEERDYKTAYSYFFEAFEASDSMSEPESLPCLKYMMLCKIASGQASDVPNLLNTKKGLKYVGVDVQALVQVAKAHEKRSLGDFETATKDFAIQLGEDPFIKRHLDQLYEQLLEANLLKLIEPFSCVEIAHLAKLIALPLAQIELKLSQMILDHKFSGTLDQGKGQLIIYQNSGQDETYATGIQVIEHVSNVVTSLFTRSQHLAA